MMNDYLENMLKVMFETGNYEKLYVVYEFTKYDVTGKDPLTMYNHTVYDDIYDVKRHVNSYTKLMTSNKDYKYLGNYTYQYPYDGSTNQSYIVISKYERAA